MTVSKLVTTLEKALRIARSQNVWVAILFPSQWKYQTTLMNILAGYGPVYGHTLMLENGGKVSCFPFSKEVQDDNIRSLTVDQSQRLIPLDEIGYSAWEAATQPIQEFSSLW